MIQEDGFTQLLIKHGEKYTSHFKEYTIYIVYIYVISILENLSIKCLEISGCIHFSSNCLINIGVYCRNIERLNISNCHRVKFHI